MSLARNAIKISEISDEKQSIQISLDLVKAARRHLSFLTTVSESPWPHNNPSICHAVRRYDELWMPLIADLTIGKTQPVILLPPLDIQWVWHCHTLNPESYRRYCNSRFSKILEKPVLHDDGNEEYALNRCSDLWSKRYPFEPFELDDISDDKLDNITTNEDIFAEVWKNRDLPSKFSEPYMLEMVYLISAKQRYTAFMYLLEKFNDGCSKLVPTLDIQLILLTHQSYPSKYTEDVQRLEVGMEKIVGIWDEMKDEDAEESRKIWEEIFDEPYERAGAIFRGMLKPPVYWVVSEVDVNTKYKLMGPRFLLEVCVFMKRKHDQLHQSQPKEDDYLQLRTVRCHKELKIDTPITSISSDTWRKTCHLYCEFTTRGLILQLRRNTSGCFKNNVKNTIPFFWNDLLRAPCLRIGKDLGRQVRVVASITVPVQAAYLLKCVPDRVTDDSGAMISDEILKMNQYRPQQGRWLSRTVLDHAGKDCFVVRIRVAGGIWRRGGETPVEVKWEESIIEIREGSWSYVVGSIGKVPEKVVGTAKPKDQSQDKASWSLSTGEELTIHKVASGFIFNLQNSTSTDSVRLLAGRKMQYQVNNENETHGEEKEDGFVTLVRYAPGNPNGRATALLNWKLVVVEFLPEEDAVMVMLICIAILRSVSEMESKDMGNLLVRRRSKEHRIGMRDWGSVVMNTGTTCSTHLQPWHWNANEVMAPVKEDHSQVHMTFKYSPAEGGDKLYKRVIMPKLKGP
ncbi:hypothetical protein ACHQM5_026451 [Ranunculus cassubicifolius]